MLKLVGVGVFERDLLRMKLEPEDIVIAAAVLINIPESEHFRLPGRPMTVLRETAVSLAFDGGNNVGMMALFHAAQMAIKKTGAHGISLVSVTDAWMSGRSAYYVEMIAKTGLVATHTVGSSQLVAPPGGTPPRYLAGVRHPRLSRVSDAAR